MRSSGRSTRTSRRARHFRLQLAAVSCLALLTSLLSTNASSTAAAAGTAGNPNPQLTKTVTVAPLTPKLGLTLRVDRLSGIPGDTLTYTATVTNTGSVLTLSGDVTVKNVNSITGQIGSYFDDFASSTNAACSPNTDSGNNTAGWTALAGTAASQPAYIPVRPPPITSGMSLALVPVLAKGVTYPTSGDAVLGTTLSPGATAKWHYKATVSLTPAQVSFLLDLVKVTETRNTFHAELTVRSQSGNGAPGTVDTTFCQLYTQHASGGVTNAVITITPPQGAPSVQFNKMTTPALASLAPGASTTVSTNFSILPIAGKAAGESDTAYVARLEAAELSILTGSATATGSSYLGSVSALPATATTTEHVPIAGIVKTGPASADAGTTAVFPLGLTNTGGATAGPLTVTDTVPDGTSGTVSKVPASLPPGGSAAAQAAFAIQASQPCGPLTDTASIAWKDANGNNYGPVSSSFTTTVTACFAGSTLTLAPQSAGPDVTGTSQTLSATFLNASGKPIADQTISFALTGANPTTGTAVTDAQGIATFTYTGNNSGSDTVQAAFTSGTFTLVSNTATVVWLTPIEQVSTTSVTGRFYFGGCGSFCANVASPVFTQMFPTIDFNPPSGTVPNNITGVGVDTRPFTDITTNAVGDFTGAVVAQGNGYQAGLSSLGSFDAVFTANLVVSKAGDQTFYFYSDDGFIFGIGNGATRVSGADSNPPGSTPLEGYPVMGAYNQPTSPIANPVTVHFPAAGTYPYEVDYSECCGGEVSLTMAGSTGNGLPPAGNLALTPINVPTQTVGAPVMLTVAAMDASGQPIAALPVTLTVSGPNSQTITGTTDAAGVAILPYTGTNPGTDLVLVGASVSGMPAISNTVGVNWAFGAGSSSSQPPPVITNLAPPDGSKVTKPVPISADITPPSGETITSWSVTYQALDPEPPVTIASGTGMPPNPLATFDPTVLPNDTYAISITATSSGGGTQTATTTVAVYGNLKLGRYVTTYQDLSVPVSGLQMEVRRTYDSIDKRAGDFGVGWRVDISNFRVTANRQLGASGWTEYPTQCIVGLCFWAFKTSVPHFVTVTWPDGHQEIFDFTPTGGAALLYFQGAAAFTPRAGTSTTSALTAEGDASLNYGFDGNLYGSNGQPYNPTRFILSTKDGRRFVLDISTGLVSETDPNGNALTVDANGIHSTLGPASSPSPGPSITFSRDSQGRITDVYGPVSGQHLHYAYFPAVNELQSVTDANLNTSSYAYDPTTGDLQKSLDPNNQPIQTLGYNPDTGRLISIANGSEPATTITTDVTGQTQTFLDPSGKLTTVLTYDDLGDVLQRDNSFNGRTLKTQYIYDPVGRTKKVVDPLNEETSINYDESNGNVLSVTSDGRTWSLENYNSLGEPGLIRKPDGTVQSTFKYDGTSGLVQSEDQSGAPPTLFTYWPAGQLKSVTDPGGRSTNYSYDAIGNLAAISDSQDRAVQLVIDAAGELRSVTDQIGNRTKFDYFPNGSLSVLTDASMNKWHYFYDSLERLRQVVDPLDHTDTYDYNVVGLLQQLKDRDGNLTTYGYNVDGLLTQETRPTNDVINYGYDPLGRLIEADNASSHIDRTYDDANRLATETTCAKTGSSLTLCSGVPPGNEPTVATSYSYFPDSQLKSTTSSNAGTPDVQYGYDGLGRLKSVQVGTQTPFGIGYDPLARVASLSRPNGITDTLQYNASNDLTARDASLNGTTVARFDYGIDPVTGRRMSMTDNVGIHTYSYYDNGWLQSATHPIGSGLANESYTYDPSGNRSSGTATSTYDGADRLQTDGTYAYAFDNEGNLKSRTPLGGGTPTTYKWNSDHELVGISYPDGTASAYRYDPFGRRVDAIDKGAETRFAFDGLTVNADYDSQNQLQTSYPSALEAVTSGGQSTYYLFDGLGSVAALTGANGNVTGSYNYNTFGMPAVGNAQQSRQTFTGYQHDAASGLYNAGARYYDPTIGRFLSEDPLSSTNPYAYAANNPVNLIDTYGMLAGEYAELLQTEGNNAQCIAGAVGTVAGASLGAVSLGFSGHAPRAEDVITSIAFGLIVNGALCSSQLGSTRAPVVTNLHHTVPTEILKTLPEDVASNPLVRGRAGAPNRWAIPEDVHVGIHAGPGGGLYNQAWKDAIEGLGRNPTVDDILGFRDQITKQFGIDIYRP